MATATPISEDRRDLLLFVGLALLFLGIIGWYGAAYGIRILVEATCYAIIALGLTVQWGYAGLFNVGVMGLVAIGAFFTMLISFPVNETFWASDGPALVGTIIFRLAVSVLIVAGIWQMKRFGLNKSLRLFLTLVAAAFCYLWTSAAIGTAATSIEQSSGFIGGFGLPVVFGWGVGAIAAGAVAFGIGKICLGLRSDYLAIATLGIAEIVKIFLKNAEWLTRGSLTVSPLSWPVPTPNEIGFVAARSAYLAITAALVVVIYLLLQRALSAPWGRMIRAIRDNEVAAEAMGKDVDRRRLEIFVLGALLMGLGGAALITFNRIFDPNGFVPLNHTFLVWVMVILGGAGNNRGAIFGALLVYVIWTLSEPMALAVFHLVEVWGGQLFGWQAPADLDSRALQMRVFMIGLTIVLVLRFAPNGVIPERVFKSGPN